MVTSFAQERERAPSNTLAGRFAEIREMSLRITQPFSAEDLMLQSMPDASPAKWHLAHTTWFFETFILIPHDPKYQAFDRNFQYLFNSYYKQLGGHPNRGTRGLMSRPSLEQVHAYRKHVDQAIGEFLGSANNDVLKLIEIGLNHEQQHQELILTDIKHGLWSGPMWPEMVTEAPKTDVSGKLEWFEFEGGIHSMGHEGLGFAFDNETPRHEVFGRPFRLASRAVTNAEFRAFIDDNGYRRPELWLSEGWDTLNAQNWSAPLYWERHEDGSWWQFTLDGTKRINPAEPVCHISFFEADAYARWAGARLPLESEWEIAATRMPSRGTLLEDGVLHPQAVSKAGLQQVFGDVWEWTASPYVGYPGFKTATGAVGEYNGKFMCNQFVLRGGSCVTPASHIRASYRNFFPPHARWQFSGLRLAQ
jgi:ergothioneine biosynthesis protein EgtB